MENKIIRTLEVSVILIWAITYTSLWVLESEVIKSILVVLLAILSLGLHNYSSDNVYPAGYTLSWFGFWNVICIFRNDFATFLFDEEILNTKYFKQMLVAIIFAAFYCLVNYLWHSKRIITNQTTNRK